MLVGGAATLAVALTFLPFQPVIVAGAGALAAYGVSYSMEIAIQI